MADGPGAPVPLRRNGERLAALFMLGLALFMPPLLAVMSRDVLVGGVPLLVLWLLGGWLALIVLMAAALEIRRRWRERP